MEPERYEVEMEPERHGWRRSERREESRRRDAIAECVKCLGAECVWGRDTEKMCTCCFFY